MLRRVAQVLAASSAIIAGLPACAHAGTRAFSDGPSDVWAEGIANPHPVPSRRQGDILRMTLAHNQRAVLVRTTFRQLNRDGIEIIAFFRLRTNTDQIGNVTVSATPRRATNRWRGKVDFSRRGSPDLDCAIAHHIDYAANLMTVRVPRTCLDDPRTVQAQVAIGTITREGYFWDNPVNHGSSASPPPYTSPVRHG